MIPDWKRAAAKVLIKDTVAPNLRAHLAYEAAMEVAQGVRATEVWNWVVLAAAEKEMYVK